MTINIKNIVNIVAKKITTADSAEAGNLLFGYLNIAQRHGLGQIKEGSDPGAPVLPSDFTSRDQDRLRYVGDKLYIRKNAGWSKQFVTQEFFQGQTSGYVSGGFHRFPNGSSTSPRSITEFSLLTGNTVTAGPLIMNNPGPAPGFMPTDKQVGVPNHTTTAYIFGGYVQPPYGYITDNINKFLFANPSTYSSDIASLAAAVSNNASASDATAGYVMGGDELPTPPNQNQSQQVQKFIFASETPATVSTTLTLPVRQNGGHSSDVNGYSAAGFSFFPGPGNVGRVDGFPFASPGGTFVAQTPELSPTSGKCSISSFTHGYLIGAVISTPTPIYVAQKYSFANNTPVTTFPYFLNTYTDATGISGENEGFYAGGAVVVTPTSPFPNSGPVSGYIQKFPYASEVIVNHANMTQSGDSLATNGKQMAGNQR